MIPGHVDKEEFLHPEDTSQIEPPKPLSVVPDIGANYVLPDEDIENDSVVNTNGLFGDNDTDTDTDIEEDNKQTGGLSKKKKKFFFRYRFK